MYAQVISFVLHLRTSTPDHCGKKLYLCAQDRWRKHVLAGLALDASQSFGSVPFMVRLSWTYEDAAVVNTLENEISSIVKSRSISPLNHHTLVNLYYCTLSPFSQSRTQSPISLSTLPEYRCIKWCPFL